MKKTSLPILAVVVGLLLLSVQSEKWIKFKSKKGKFEIMFPGKPSGSDQTAPTAVGEISIHMDMYTAGTGAWGVSYNDYPPKLIEGQDEYALLSEAISGATGSMGINTMESKKEGKWQNYPCIDYKGYSTENDFYSIYKVVLKDNRLYQIVTLGSGDYLPNSKKFLSSFKIKK